MQRCSVLQAASWAKSNATSLTARTAAAAGTAPLPAPPAAAGAALCACSSTAAAVRADVATAGLSVDTIAASQARLIISERASERYASGDAAPTAATVSQPAWCMSRLSNVCSRLRKARSVPGSDTGCASSGSESGSGLPAMRFCSRCRPPCTVPAHPRRRSPPAGA